MEKEYNSTKETFFIENSNVDKCKTDLSKYFHPENTTLKRKFRLLYQLSDFSDDSLAREIGVDRTTMNRYRRGVWIPSKDTKLKICKILTEKIGKYIAVEMIWNNSSKLNLKEEK